MHIIYYYQYARQNANLLEISLLLKIKYSFTPLLRNETLRYYL